MRVRPVVCCKLFVSQAIGAGDERLPALLRGHIAQGTQSDNMFERPRLWRAVSDDTVQQEQLPTSLSDNGHIGQLPNSSQTENGDVQIIRAVSVDHIDCDDGEIPEDIEISPEDVDVSD